jgi:large subunit ribosomal protein L28
MILIIPYLKAANKSLPQNEKKLLHFVTGFVMIVQLLKGGASIMAKCECCGKGVSFGIKVSHSHRRSNRTWNPNVKRVKAIVGGSPKYIYACTRCLRSGKVTRAV